MNAPTLFDVPPSRHDDPQTSKDAAARVGVVSGKLRAQILDLMSQRRGLTKNETCQHLDVDPIHWPSVASALSQLRRAGRLEWTGEIRAHQNVWRLRTEPVDVAGEQL